MFGVTGSGDTSGYGRLVRTIPTPGSSNRPFGGDFDYVADELERAFPAFNEAIEKIVVDRGELTLHVRVSHLLQVAKTLRDTPTLRYEMCLGVVGAHYPEDSGRELHAIYPLLSLTHNRRIRIEVSVPISQPQIPSVVSLWASNNWHEREAFDMFGIDFTGHPGLTRILMPDDWQSFPQRKDYALGGVPVEYKGATVPPPDERRSYL